MEAPNRRFSLGKILPTPARPIAPAPSTDAQTPRLVPAPALQTPATRPTERRGSLPGASELLRPPELKPQPAIREESAALPIAPKSRTALKRKRSYSVDPAIVDDFEALAWSLATSSSALVEKLMRQHLAEQAKALEKAKLMKPVAASA